MFIFIIFIGYKEGFFHLFGSIGFWNYRFELYFKKITSRDNWCLHGTTSLWRNRDHHGWIYTSGVEFVRAHDNFCI